MFYLVTASEKCLNHPIFSIAPPSCTIPCYGYVHTIIYYILLRSYFLVVIRRVRRAQLRVRNFVRFFQFFRVSRLQLSRSFSLVHFCSGGRGHFEYCTAKSETPQFVTSYLIFDISVTTETVSVEASDVFTLPSDARALPGLLSISGLIGDKNWKIIS